ncbi:transcription factor-like 5 protein [Spea bombifrons]|uniref:transcription factor-like 5 protein n=1 Tax=Spea bombifrons TaxID=233779 RepID=UPI00234A7343|nr:transcription factor-like 5 protein [Spea bombifrons]
MSVMFGSMQAQPKVSSDPTPCSGPSCSGESTLSDQGVFAATDMSVVEMTEVEYTQLQQILYSHMEAQAGEGEMENRLNSSSFFTSGNLTNHPQYQPPSMNQHSFPGSCSGGQNVHSVICQSSAASEANPLGPSDFQDLRMVMLGESNAPLNSGNQAERTPGGNCRELLGLQVRHPDNAGAANKENENLVSACEARCKSAVRVRLEDRFNSIRAEMPRAQEQQESGVTLSNLVTLIRHPSQLMGVQQQSKCTGLLKSKTPAGGSALPFGYPVFGSAAGSTPGAPQTQTSVCPHIEAAKQQAMSLPRTVSICYQQENESSKHDIDPRNKVLTDQLWLKVGEALRKQNISKRGRTRIRQPDASAERKVLSNIQNISDAPAAAWSSAQANNESAAGGRQPLAGSSQRREKHNRMERDRRRRIRICCDELNSLVPFCNSDTDKASTLQWTTAFLKYIQERHGDSLKKEFESVFCGKTGGRLKANRSDVFRAGLAQEAVPSSSHTVMQ